MIDETQTLSTYGYRSVDLAEKSHKKIVASCDDCGNRRHVNKSAYRSLCKSCVKSSKRLSKETRRKYSLSKLGCKNYFYGKKHDSKAIEKIKEFRRQNPSKSRLPLGEACFNRLFRTYVSHAYKRGLAFELSKDEARRLFKSNCHYCDISPSCILLHLNTHGEFVYNGIDRKDNQIGYNRANCVSCCKTCNLAKRDMKYNEFLFWLKSVSLFGRWKDNDRNNQE